MTSEIQCLKKLKDLLINFLDALIDKFQSEPDFLIFRIFINDQVPIESVMKYIVEKLLPLKEMVDKKNENFFLANNVLFGIDEKRADKVNHFKRLWTSDEMSSEDKDMIWQWFSLFLKTANNYVRCKKSADDSKS